MGRGKAFELGKLSDNTGLRGLKNLVDICWVAEVSKGITCFLLECLSNCHFFPVLLSNSPP